MKLITDTVILEFTRNEINEISSSIKEFDRAGIETPSILSKFLVIINEKSGDVIKDSVIDFIKDGKKIHAIKELRSYTGLGLKEAKDMVDQWTSEIERYGIVTTQLDLYTK